MFCNQSRFDLPTAIVTVEIFNNLVDSAQTRWLTTEHRKLREALPAILEGNAELLNQLAQDENFMKFCQGQEASRKRGSGGKTKGELFQALPIEKKLQMYCDNLKKSLPFVIFIATYAETASASGKLGCWRKQAACRLNGLCVIDFDHIEGDCREVWAEAFAKLSDEDKARILLVYITPSGHGLKVVFMADVNVGNLIDNQKAFSAKLGLNPDEACKDASRGAFLTTRQDIILLNEKLFTYENEEFGKKYNDEYHAGHSQPTLNFAESHPDHAGMASVQTVGKDQQGVLDGNGGSVQSADALSYNGVPYTKIIEAWLEGVNLEQNRHNTLVELASHLRYLIGKNAKKIEEVVMQLPWVKDLAAEGENVSSTIGSVIEFKYRENMPKRLKEALEKVGANHGDRPHDLRSATITGVSPHDSPEDRRWQNTIRV